MTELLGFGLACAGAAACWIPFEAAFRRRGRALRDDLERRRREAEEAQAAAAADLAGMEKELDRQRLEADRLLAMYELIREMAEVTEPGRLYTLLRRWCETHLNATGCGLWIHLKEANRWHLAGAVGLPAAEAAEALEKEAEGPWFHREDLALVPIRLDGGRVGGCAIRLARTRPADLPERLEALARCAALPVERSRLYLETEERMRTDGLTGLLRRKPLEERIREEIRRAGRTGQRLSLVLADVDHFKKLNDTYGHQAGDEVLRQVGRILKEGIYETDVAGRYGGEEFALLLVGADPSGAEQKAEKLRRRIQEQPVDLGFTQVKVTASFGVAHFPLSGRDYEGLLSAADTALYRAKAEGRNRVEAHRP